MVTVGFNPRKRKRNSSRVAARRLKFAKDHDVTILGPTLSPNAVGADVQKFDTWVGDSTDKMESGAGIST
jgi:hypothetical protein